MGYGSQQPQPYIVQQPGRTGGAAGAGGAGCLGMSFSYRL